uniref:Uncharacterized protein n=1 Tax=Knipowitschia caucasica TaxID=637954 RepID=A0AAV2LRY8_KNICA
MNQRPQEFEQQKLVPESVLLCFGKAPRVPEEELSGRTVTELWKRFKPHLQDFQRVLQGKGPWSAAKQRCSSLKQSGGTSSGHRVHSLSPPAVLKPRSLCSSPVEEGGAVEPQHTSVMRAVKSTVTQSGKSRATFHNKRIRSP